MLRVTNLTGFGQASWISAMIELTVSASENDYVVFTEALAAATTRGPDEDVGNGEVIVYLDDSVVIGSTSTATGGLVTGSGWGAGWRVRIIIRSGDSARIQGKGGVGGVGRISNVTGEAMGAGGGGAGTQAGAGHVYGASQPDINDGQNGTATAGGAGGTSAVTIDADATAAAAGGVGGPAIVVTADANAPPVTLEPESTATLEVWAGGGGGGGGGSGASISGGAGGGPGLSGSTPGGTTPGAGGAAGSAYVQTGNTITEAGDGTIDARGA